MPDTQKAVREVFAIGGTILPPPLDASHMFSLGMWACALPPREERNQVDGAA